MKKLTLIAIFIASITLYGCNEDNAATYVPTELEGSWVTICKANDENDGYWTISQDVSGNKIAHNGHTYTDANCTVPDPRYGSMLIISGTFTIGSSITTGDGLTAKKIDINIQYEEGLNVNYTIYDIFRISDGVLHMGNPFYPTFGSSDVTRPVYLDFSEWLTKI